MADFRLIRPGGFKCSVFLSGAGGFPGLVFIAQIAQIESLRALAEKVKNDIDLQNNLKLESISASQLM